MDRYPETTFEDLLDALRSRPSGCSRCWRRCATRSTWPTPTAWFTRASPAPVCSDGGRRRCSSTDSALSGGPRELSVESVGVHEVRYCPPEELRGEPLEPASNVYSLAALLVHALTGDAALPRRPPAPRPTGTWSSRRRGRASACRELGSRLRRRRRARAWPRSRRSGPASAGELLREAAAALGVELPRTVAGRAGTRPRSRGADAVPLRSASAASRAGGGRAPRSSAALAGRGGGRRARSVRRRARPGRGAERRRAGARAPGRPAHAAEGDPRGGETPQEQAAAAAELAGAYGRAARRGRIAAAGVGGAGGRARVRGAGSGGRRGER